MRSTWRRGSATDSRWWCRDPGRAPSIRCGRGPRRGRESASGARPPSSSMGSRGSDPVTAQKIIGFRDQHGGLSSVNQLDQVDGIGPSTMQTLRGRACSPERPVRADRWPSRRSHSCPGVPDAFVARAPGCRAGCCPRGPRPPAVGSAAIEATLLGSVSSMRWGARGAGVRGSSSSLLHPVELAFTPRTT